MAFADECAVMMEDVAERLGATVTLVAVAAGVLNTTALTRAVTTESQSITAARRPLDHDVVRAAEGALTVDGCIYDVPAADVTIGGGVPKKGWRVTDGGATFEVVEVDRLCERACFSLVCRRAA